MTDLSEAIRELERAARFFFRHRVLREAARTDPLKILPRERAAQVARIRSYIAAIRVLRRAQSPSYYRVIAAIADALPVDPEADALVDSLLSERTQGIAKKRPLTRRRPTRITRAEFRADPDRYIAEADAGPVHVVDEAGMVCMVLSSPGSVMSPESKLGT